MTVGIYNKLKTVIAGVKDSNGIAIFKTVTRYNAQVEHLLKEKNDNGVVLFPACFIQFANVNCTNLQSKATVQHCSFDTILHLAFDILLDDDTQDLVAKQLTYAVMQVFEFGANEPTCSRFTRTGEEPPDDESLVLVHRQKYTALLKDFDAIPLANTGTVNTLTINPEIDPAIV